LAAPAPVQKTVIAAPDCDVWDIPDIRVEPLQIFDAIVCDSQKSMILFLADRIEARASRQRFAVSFKSGFEPTERK
jgi:hypothetical protein